MWALWQLLVVILGLYHCAGEKRGLYHRNQVWRVIPQDENQVEELYQLSVQNEQLEYWKEARHSGDEAQIMVPSTKLSSTRKYLKKVGIDIEVIIGDVNRVVSAERSKLTASRFDRNRKANVYDQFHDYDEILSLIDNMVKRCPVKLGVLCDTYTIGRTFEGRDLTVFRMYKDEPDRPVYWVDSLIHAREWLAGATNLKIANHLITSYASDPEAKMLVDDGDWHFLFVHNPDGYVFTWTDDRYWRKNRYNNTLVRDTSCMGVDLNRNFDMRWGNTGTSYEPCSQVYRGISPASQLEAQSVQNEIKRLSQRLKGFVSIHAAISMVLSAFGSLTDTSDRSSCEYLQEPKRSNLDMVIESMTNAINDTFEYSYWRGGNICSTIYPASGGSSDYATVHGTVYSLTIEVRDRGENGGYYGFNAPATEINLSFIEIWNGLVTMVESINEIEGKS